MSLLKIKILDAKIEALEHERSRLTAEIISMNAQKGAMGIQIIPTGQDAYEIKNLKLSNLSDMRRLMSIAEDYSIDSDFALVTKDLLDNILSKRAA